MIHTEPPRPAGSDLQARSGAYLLFARIFRKAPTPALLRELVEHQVLTTADPEWPRQAEAIAVEHARLFAVPGEHAVRPYESVYCDTLSIDTSTACSAYFVSEPSIVGLTGYLGGPSSIAVRQAYRQAGFSLDPESHELPDHLAIELEFLGLLLNKEAQAEAGSFFREHLGRWAGRCLEDLRHRAPVGFYCVVADSAGAFLDGERRLCLDPALEHICSHGAERTSCEGG